MACLSFDGCARVAGWTGGSVVLIAAYIISVWTLWQLCAMHEINGKRMNRYHELGQYAFGRTGIAFFARCLSRNSTSNMEFLR